MVVLTSIPAHGETTVVYEADTKPWSGYWWPSTNGGMLTGIGYRGAPAPLDKLHGISPLKADLLKDWYALNFFKPDGEAWFGLCHAWSLAAIAEPEPTRGGVFQGVPLNVGDKKAFLTLAHAGDLCLKVNGADPLIFHQWILTFLRDQKKAFSANLQFQNEIWYFPIYKAAVTQTDHGSYSEFSTVVWYASDLVHPDFVGIKELSTVFTYRLSKQDGIFTKGVWTGESENHYPGELWSTLQRQGPPVEGFDLALIDRAVRTNTDDLTPSELYPGAFSAFFDGVWQRPLGVQAGEWIELEFKLENQYVELPVTIMDGNFTSTWEISWANPIIRYQTVNAYPVMQFRPDPSMTNSPFSMFFDVARDVSSALTRRDSTFSWAGFAGFVSLDAVDHGGLLTVRRRDGRPLRSVPLSAPVGTKSSHLAMLPEYDSWVFGPAMHCDITSLGANAMVGLNGNQRGMNPFIHNPRSGVQWVVGSLQNHGLATSFHVRNTESKPVSGSVKGWNEKGEVVFSQNVTLAPHELRYFAWGSYPMPSLRGGSLFSIDFNDAKVFLEACFTSSRSTELVSGLPLGGREYFLSHYPNDGVWRTFLHLLNPNDQVEEVSLETLDGRRLQMFSIPARTALDIDTSALQATGQTLRLVSDNSVGAYVRYQSPVDWAMMPLLSPSAARTEVLVPHVPTAPWWTGVILDNPDSRECRVTLDYFDSSGSIVKTEQRVLNGYEPWVFMASRFPDSGFLRIKSSRNLGCSVLYGTDDLSGVTGFRP